MTSTLMGQTRREGYDLDARYAVVKDRRSEVALFGNYSAVDAFRLDASRDFVPNVPVYPANLGIDLNLAMGGGERILGQAFVGFIGKKYLSEDGQLTTSPYQRVSAKVGYAWPSGWSAFTQATWYPGNRDSEFAFDFANPSLLALATSLLRRFRNSPCLPGSRTGFPPRSWRWKRA